MLAVPVAQALVHPLAAGRRLGAYFGFLASVGGLVVLIGRTAVGALLDHGGRAPVVAWLVLTAVPLVGAAVMECTRAAGRCRAG